MGAWTLSDPPQAVLEKEKDTNLRFWRCSNDWWDYCLAAGEQNLLLYFILIKNNVSTWGLGHFPPE